MMRRAMNTGIIGGLVISLGSTYPFLVLVMPLVVPNWQRPIPNEFVHTAVLMISAAIALPAVFVLGGQAARHARVKGWTDGLKAGLLAGVFAGLIFFITIVMPFISMRAYQVIAPHYADVAEDFTIIAPQLRRYGEIFERSSYLMEITLAIAAVFWGLQGAFIGWRRRNVVEEKRPSLHTLHQTGRHPREWFKGDESAVRAGVLVGLGIGLLLAILSFSSLTQASSPLEWIQSFGISDQGVMVGEEQPFTIAAFLWPLAIISFVAFGLIVVIVMKNPPDLFRSRWRGITLAGVIISVFMFSLLEQLAFFVVGISPFLIQQAIRLSDATDMQTIEADMESFQAFIDSVFASSSGSAPLMYFAILMPWVLLLLAVIVGIILGFVQSVIFGTIAPMIHKRPVDKAALLKRRMNSEPEKTLPLMYSLFQKEADAYDILTHVAVRTYNDMPAVSQMASALHTLGSSRQPDAYGGAIQGVQMALSEKMIRGVGNLILGPCMAFWMKFWQPVI